MRRITAVIDSYGYIPLVRTVFSQRIFRPAFGETTNESVFREGLKESAHVLDALEKLLGDNEYIAAGSYSLADAHAIPMIDYFTMAEEGNDMLRGYPKLTQWWGHVKERPSTLSTRPKLPSRY